MDYSQKAIIKNNLNEIKFKIDNCQALRNAFDSIKAYPSKPSSIKNYDQTIELNIVRLYVDLVNYCKKQNIV